MHFRRSERNKGVIHNMHDVANLHEMVSYRYTAAVKES